MNTPKLLVLNYVTTTIALFAAIVMHCAITFQEQQTSCSTAILRQIESLPLHGHKASVNKF